MGTVPSTGGGFLDLHRRYQARLLCVLCARNSDHLKPLGLCKLDGELPDAAAGADDEHAVAGLGWDAVQRL